MNCKTIKDLLMTDYQDNRLSPVQKRTVEEHLENCADCREVFQEIQESQENFLQGLEMKKVPEDVWLRIEEKLDEKEAHGLAAGWENFLSGLRVFFRPMVLVPAATFILMAVFVSSVFGPFRTAQPTTTAALTEDESYYEQVVYLDNITEEEFSLDTGIEEYFL